MREGRARAWEGGHGARPASKDADGVKVPGVGTLGCLPGPGKPSQTPISSPVVRRPSQDTASSEGRCVGQCSRHLPLGPHGCRLQGPRSHPGCTTSPVSLICKTRIIRQPAPSVGVRLMWVRHARVQPLLAFPIAIWSPKGTLRISLASRNLIKVEEMERKREEGGGGRRPSGRKKLV